MANPKIDAMAKAMAAADGLDPNLPVIGQQVGRVLGNIIFGDRDLIGQPSWQEYAGLARLILAAIQEERKPLVED